MIIYMKVKKQEETEWFPNKLCKKMTKKLNLGFIFCGMCDIVFNYIQSCYVN